MLLESAVAVDCCLANVVRNAAPWKNFKLNRNAGRRSCGSRGPGAGGQASSAVFGVGECGGPGRAGADWGGLESGLAPPLLLLAGMRKQEAVDS